MKEDYWIFCKENQKLGFVDLWLRRRSKDDKDQFFAILWGSLKRELAEHLIASLGIYAEWEQSGKKKDKPFVLPDCVPVEKQLEIFGDETK